MAYITPKTDWNETYEPSPSDMNRIEGNTKQNHDDIVQEATDRAAGDNQILTGNNTFSGNNTHSGTNTYSGNNTHSGSNNFTGTTNTFSGTIDAGIFLPKNPGVTGTILVGLGATLIPRGLYIFAASSLTTFRIQFQRSPGIWTDTQSTSLSFIGGTFVSDGVNVRFQNDTATAPFIPYLKF